MAWDSPLGPLADLVGSCADAVDGADGQVTMDRLVVEMPIELQVSAVQGGPVSLAVAPPRQALETAVMPVLHRLRIVVVTEP